MGKSEASHGQNQSASGECAVSETIEEFLKRGGQITKIKTPDHDSDTRSDYSAKDKIDVVTKSKGKSLGAQKMFNNFVTDFLGKNNNNWKWGKK